MPIIQYTRSTFNSENTLTVNVPFDDYKVPSKSSPERDGRDIWSFLEEEFEKCEAPATDDSRSEERGNEYTSHYIRYWD